MTRKYRGYKTGADYAREHVEAAERLSVELGGTDEELKRWFFSLSDTQLNKIFISYERQYGTKPAAYARATYKKWKVGKTKMSGLVAERLYSLLPNFMPASIKLDLIESLWEHMGPSGSRVITAGRHADINALMTQVTSEVVNMTTFWEIPAHMKFRFNWLSGNDSVISQRLFSHIKAEEKRLGEEILTKKLPSLKARFEGDLKGSATMIAETLKISKQTLEIRLQGEHSKIRSGPEVSANLGHSSSATRATKTSEGEFDWGGVAFIFWLGVIAIGVLGS